MAVFEYKALNRSGKKISGILNANNLFAAKLKLRQSEIYPIEFNKIENDSPSKKKFSDAFISKFKFISTVSSAELSLITRQMSTLISSGFPLVEVLSILVTQTKSKTMQKVLSSIKNAIEEGSSFANALELYPGIFSTVFINMVKAGESSGTLELVLERLADFIENRENSKRKIQASLAYPVFMSFIGIAILILLLSYVVPGIVNIFTDMNQNLPLPTIILLSISSFFQSYWWSIVLLPLFLLLSVIILKKNDKGAYWLDQLLISTPIFGSLLKKIIAARITRTLGSLLGNGVPMLTALHITKSIAGNRVIYELLSNASGNVEKGGELGVVLAENSDFPYLASQMIKIGEASGEIERMLEKTADLFEKDVDATMTAAVSLIEPLIIIIMGIVVGCIIFAICLPIFEINQLIQ